MSRLVRRIRYIVMMVLLLLAGRYALNLRQHYRAVLSRVVQVQDAFAQRRVGATAAPNPRREHHQQQPKQIGAIMSEPSTTGRLPDPQPVPTANLDEAAIELAREVSQKDEHSVPALIAAFKLAGFCILSDDGSVLVGAKNTGQGIGFESREVASIAKLYGDGLHITLANLSAAMTETLPGFKNVPLSKLLLEGIQADTESSKPELRFWSRFIVELGRQAVPSYDLASPNVDTASVQFDAVQFGFISRSDDDACANISVASQAYGDRRLGPARTKGGNGAPRESAIL